MGIVVGTLTWVDPANDLNSHSILIDIQALMHKYGLLMYEHSWNETGHRFSVIVGLRGVLLHSYGKPRLYDFYNELQQEQPTVVFQFNVGVQ